MKYFNISEFTCKCGCGTNLMNTSTLEKIDNAREIAGIPFVITSGYRCEAHNRRVGGAANSSHTRGHAADIRANTSRNRYLVVNALIKAGFNRIGWGRGFIHCDDDPSLDPEVMWDY